MRLCEILIESVEFHFFFEMHNSDVIYVIVLYIVVNILSEVNRHRAFHCLGWVGLGCSARGVFRAGWGYGILSIFVEVI